MSMEDSLGILIKDVKTHILSAEVAFRGGNNFIPKRHKCVTDGNAFFFFYSWQGPFLAEWHLLFFFFN